MNFPIHHLSFLFLVVALFLPRIALLVSYLENGLLPFHLGWASGSDCVADSAAGSGALCDLPGPGGEWVVFSASSGGGAGVERGHGVCASETAWGGRGSGPAGVTARRAGGLPGSSAWRRDGVAGGSSARQETALS